MTAASLTFPLCVKDGRLEVSKDADVVRDQILSALETRFFERVMQPRYGTPDLVFESHSGVGVVAERTRQTLAQLIPQANFEVSGELADSGVYTLRIQYWIAQQLQPTLTLTLTL